MVPNEIQNLAVRSALATTDASAPPSPDLVTAHKDFHLKEYESLREEIADLVEHSRKIEIYAVGGIAAFYAWFLKAGSKPDRLTLLIPVLLTLLGGLRSLSVLQRISEIAEYLLKVEDVFAQKPSLTGWEHHRKPKNSSPFFASATVVWVLLLMTTILAIFRLEG